MRIEWRVLNSEIKRDCQHRKSTTTFTCVCLILPIRSRKPERAARARWYSASPFCCDASIQHEIWRHAAAEFSLRSREADELMNWKMNTRTLLNLFDFGTTNVESSQIWLKPHKSKFFSIFWKHAQNSDKFKQNWASKCQIFLKNKPSKHSFLKERTIGRTLAYILEIWAVQK